MRYRRDDVVARAVDVLDGCGLADLTMRRLGAELGVQPSALYHHFANKQSLLAAVADEILARASWPLEGLWEERATGICSVLRDSLLAYRDGAEVVATVWSFGLGAAHPYEALVDALAEAGLGELATVAARTLLHFVYGHAVDEQTHLQAASVGAIDDEPREASDFETGLGLVMAGIQLAVAVRGA
ncbi:TetR/AcrR family transcriptional regulator C-terminal domain-containing protein [Nocardioides sp. CER19]|uniref:TetR/AcrR family transcriptional regulator C-terminal domain-containing protein n=1 Tax=Nocardioides sp. CER19 TaxID=3038538 RepID=UPI00244A94B3|nr:TetR/AcrR family transcriptional regulator C-terminal domain-containing protein [Nocardioides sp. CER19]MDH2414135.1 TetR/AcrR family transcriptional regulator C-terminal domain-containing protein [Nocardioides sp. CER19]